MYIFFTVMLSTIWSVLEPRPCRHVDRRKLLISCITVKGNSCILGCRRDTVFRVVSRLFVLNRLMRVTFVPPISWGGGGGQLKQL